MIENKCRKNELAETLEMVNGSDISVIQNIVSGIIRIINNPEATVKELHEIIQIDPPLASRVLRLANSAYYAPPQKITELMRAIVRLGFDEIRELVLTQKVCRIFKSNGLSNGHSRTSLWKHCLYVAALSKMIYRREFCERGDNAYAAGLLHDLGLIVFDQFHHNKFNDVLLYLNNGEDIINAECRIFGFDHAELACALLESWNIPKELCFSIGSHHNPLNADTEYSRMAKTLYIADFYCRKAGLGFGSSSPRETDFYDECLESLNLNEKALDLIMENVKKDVSEMVNEGFFN